MSQHAARGIHEFDYRGLKCPQPIVAISKAVRDLDEGASTIHVLSDDDAFPDDLRSWCRVTKATLMKLDRQRDGAYSALVRVSRKAPEPQRMTAGDDARSSRSLASGERSRERRSGARRSTLDCRGMPCPAPIVNLARLARELDPGAAIEVLADDEAFAVDVKSWCRTSGASLKSLTREGGVFRAIVQVERASRAVNSPDLAAARPVTTPPVTTPPVTTPPVTTPPVATPPVTTPPGTTPPVTTPPVPGQIRIDLSGTSAEVCASMLDALTGVHADGTRVTLTAAHASFPRDLTAWCVQSGHQLEYLDTGASPIAAQVTLKQGASERAAALTPVSREAPILAHGDAEQCTLLVLRNDLESLLAALMTANSAASCGMTVNIFFSFWGVNVLRGRRTTPASDGPATEPTLIQRVLKWLMPRGPRKQKLGKMSMGGMGDTMIRRIMKNNNIMSLEELVMQACELGVQFTVCTTSMTVMGITADDLMDLPNISYAGATSFVGDARNAGLSLVF